MKKRKRLTLFTLIFMFLFSTTAFAATEAPNLIGKAAISVDMDTNEIIYTKNIDNKMYPASITKLMTALLLAENKKSTDELTYTQTAKNQPPYSYNLNVHPVAVGDTISADGVMDILLLYSGNDIAYMIADNVGGDAKNFENMMNDKAKKLNMTGTHFITPNGLDDANDMHYTTPYDLTLLGKSAYKNPWVKKSMAKKTSQVQSLNGPVGTVENRNKLLGKDGCMGGKTGYTTKAGRCLVAVYERNGRHIIGVVMKSENDAKDTKVFEDMEKLINWSYTAPKSVLHAKDTAVKTETVEYNVLPFIGPKKTAKIPVALKQDLKYYNNDVKPVTTVKLDKVSPWKLDKDNEIGTLEFSQREAKGSYKVYPLISKSDIIKDNIIIYAGAAIGVIVVVILVIFSFMLLRRQRGRRRY